MESRRMYAIVLLVAYTIILPLSLVQAVEVKAGDILFGSPVRSDAGGYTEGVFRVDALSSSVATFHVDTCGPRFLKDIAFGLNGEIFLLLDCNSLLPDVAQLDPASGTLISPPILDSDSLFLTVDLLPDRDGSLLILCHSAGSYQQGMQGDIVLRVNPTSHAVTTVVNPSQLGSYTLLQSFIPTGLAMDQQGHLFIAGYHGSTAPGNAMIVKVNPANSTAETFATLEGLEQISDVAIDKAGYIYVAGTLPPSSDGTFYIPEKGAVIKISPQNSGEQTVFTNFQADPIPWSSVSKITIDLNNDLLVTSSQGILRFTPTGGETLIYDPSPNDVSGSLLPHAIAVMPELENPACNTLDLLQSYYDSKKGTNQAPFIHQFLCIEKRSCEEYAQNGTQGWASGFVKFLFDFMVDDDGLTKSVKFECPSWVSNGNCFDGVGKVHGIELAEGFYAYCKTNQEGIDYERWDEDHNAFIDNAVVPCFDEVEEAGELSLGDVLYYKNTIAIQAKTLRESIQALCSAPPVISLVASQFAMSVALAEPPQFPAPLTKEQLYNEALAKEGTLSVMAEDGSFFFPVGTTVQLQVIRRNPDGSTSNLTSSPDNEYIVIANKENVIVTAEGKLSFTSTYYPDPINPTQISITVRNGNDYGIGQFAITDTDSDSDGMVDSHETKVGRDPQKADDVQNDRDSDGLPDIGEAYLQTDPNKWDTDGDGYSDKEEIDTRTDPRDANLHPYPPPKYLPPDGDGERYYRSRSSSP